ncbi:trimethylamine methyltransferase family protein [bacterium]|nr:trimethylamine methyltransferase family protein [bacterium]
MNTSQQVQPRLSLLTQDQIERVHSNTLQVLSTTGIRVDSPHARSIFTKAMGNSSNGNIIRIPAEFVEQALKTVPSSIDIYNRRGQKVFSLGNDQISETRFGIGVTNIWYEEPQSNEIKHFSRKHVGLASQLGQTLDNFDLVSTPGIIQDDSGDDREVIAALEMVANTTKPLVLLISETSQFEQTLELLEHLNGDLSSKPFIIPYFNPITPLVLNEDTTDKLFSTIERDLPFIFSSYGMYGATAPITASATLVMLNAELLAGLVFAQLVKAGTPAILGSLPSVFEMKNMISTYTPQTMQVNLACAEMMAHYGIPHCGTSGSGSGWGPDLLASGALWLNHLTSSLGRVGLAPFVGGNFDSLVFSPATVVYSNEVIRQIRQFSRGFSIDAETMGLDDIQAVGPGGSFLMSEQTLALYREIHEQHSHVWQGFSLDNWRSQGSPRASDVLRDHVLDVMASMQVPDDHDALIERGEAFLYKKR